MHVKRQSSKSSKTLFVSHLYHNTGTNRMSLEQDELDSLIKQHEQIEAEYETEIDQLQQKVFQLQKQLNISSREVERLKNQVTNTTANDSLIEELQKVKLELEVERKRVVELENVNDQLEADKR